jgi:hypothetical protein
MLSSNFETPEPVRAVCGAQTIKQRLGRCIHPLSPKTILAIRTMGFGIFVEAVALQAHERRVVCRW